jgi:hypothetical protein
MPRRSLRPLLVAGVASFLLLAAAPSARAVEATLFVTYSYPRDNWGYGWGADLSFSFLKLVVLGMEGARQTSPFYGGTMTYFTGHALLALPIRNVTLYGGVGAGFVYQGASGSLDSDFGGLNALILGGKLRVQILVLKAEYRRLGLTGSPPLPFDDRLSFGAGISF